VHRHFPLVKVHTHALRAAEPDEAAAAQGKFWEMHRLLYLGSNKLNDKELRGYASEVGLNLARFDHEMASGFCLEQILRDFYSSLNNGISGTPNTFINGGGELIGAIKAIVEEHVVNKH
jgi:protein-disulfide isomerase